MGDAIYSMLEQDRPVPYCAVSECEVHRQYAEGTAGEGGLDERCVNQCYHGWFEFTRWLGGEGLRIEGCGGLRVFDPRSTAWQYFSLLKEYGAEVVPVDESGE